MWPRHVLDSDTFCEICERAYFLAHVESLPYFFSLSLWITVLCLSSQPHISCSRITEQICCTTISYCAVQQEFHTHGNVSSHVFGLDLCAYVSEIRTETVRFVLMCGMPVSPCVLKHFKRLAYTRHKHTRLHLLKKTTGHKYLSQQLKKHSCCIEEWETLEKKKRRKQGEIQWQFIVKDW